MPIDLRAWRCCECGRVEVGARPGAKDSTWRWYHGIVAYGDGVSCSDACDDAMHERWGLIDLRGTNRGTEPPFTHTPTDPS